MKKNIAIIACILSPFIHGMEMRSFGLVFNGTTIVVKTGCIFEANNKVDLIVINKHHHKKLVDFVDTYYINQPNSPHYIKDNTRILPRTEPYDLIKKKPLIPQKFYYTISVPERSDCTSPKISAKEATENITSYFVFILEKSLVKIGVKKKEKSIALTPLSQKSGFNKDHLTLGTATGIFKFLKEYPYAYDYIDLIVEDPHDVGTYTDLFLSIQQMLLGNSEK